MSQSEVANLEALAVDTGPSTFAYFAYFALILLVVGGVIGLVVYILGRGSDDDEKDNKDNTDTGTTDGPTNGGTDGGGNGGTDGGTNGGTDGGANGGNTGNGGTQKPQTKDDFYTTNIILLVFGFVYVAVIIPTWAGGIYKAFDRVLENPARLNAAVIGISLGVVLSVIPPLVLGQVLRNRERPESQEGAINGFVITSYVLAGISVIPIGLGIFFMNDARRFRRKLLGGDDDDDFTPVNEQAEPTRGRSDTTDSVQSFFFDLEEEGNKRSSRKRNSRSSLKRSEEEP